MNAKQFEVTSYILGLEIAYRKIASLVLVDGETLLNACSTVSSLGYRFSCKTAVEKIEEVRLAHAKILEAYAGL